MCRNTLDFVSEYVLQYQYAKSDESLLSRNSTQIFFAPLLGIANKKNTVPLTKNGSRKLLPKVAQGF